jgi:nondiscriminating glutamyl-tRNA synthetase
MTVRTRFAPSPTGYAHLGFVSRALIIYALAKKNSGQFIWRNEDTDMERFVPDALKFNMHWMLEFGLDWDEGPAANEFADKANVPEDEALKGGPYAPYTQSLRAEIGMYQEATERLISNGYAYRCFCTKERLAELRQVQELAKLQTRYDGHCRNLTQAEVDTKVANGESFTVRIKVPKDRKIEFDDLITHNHIVWDSNEVDDAIIVKSNGVPTYHLAAMYDDVVMKVTHALRGSEWLPSTPIHMLIFEGLGIKPEDRPGIGHFTVILDPATPGKKMSKRNDSFRVNGLLRQGYLKAAILNYLMLLGWAPKDNREMFSLEEFVQAFDLSGMQKANPTWNQQKMDWFNGVYLRKLEDNEYLKGFNKWLHDYLLNFTDEEKKELDDNLNQSEDRDSYFFTKLFGSIIPKEKYKEIYLLAVSLDNLDKRNTFYANNLNMFDRLMDQLMLVKERAVNFLQALEQISFFYNAPKNVDWNIKQTAKFADKIVAIKTDITELFTSMSDDAKSWEHTVWEPAMRAIADKHEVKHGDAFMVLRLAVAGSPFSPPLFESLQILGKAEVVSRLSR